MDSEASRPKNANYLIKAASLLPTENYAQKLLKSYYLTKSYKLSRTDINSQPKPFFSDEETCRKCSMPWTDANYSMSVAPVKMSKRKANKIRQQIDDKSSPKHKMSKKLAKKVNNIVAIKCDFCKSRNRVILWNKTQKMESRKRKREIEQRSTEDSKEVEEVIAVDVEPPMKKKKRKKDKSAGLLFTINKDNQKAEKVQTATIHSNSQTNSLGKKLKTSLTLNQPKQNNKSNKKKATVQLKPAAPEFHKKSGLLQLANALKAKGNQSTSNKSSNDKLKQMMR